MKITELHIYGYGQLENISITTITDFQVFYGENEAGKSTIMSFIHAILFGFPTKAQIEPRYEPKQSSKYGGKIRIYHETLGYAVVERVKGKATGDVKVVLDHGETGGEELLEMLVADFDKNLFQAIFSFNLHGLQNIHQLKGEEIGRFLFSAGTLGTDQLAKADAALQKELDIRFKPSGKKPLLNEMLQELHELNGQLKKAAGKNKEYENLIERKSCILQEMEAIRGRIYEINRQVDKWNEWKRIESIVKNEKRTQQELEALGDVEFPARGIERAEKLTQFIHPYKAEIASITERIDNLHIELADLEPDITYLEHEAVIVSALDQIPFTEQLKHEEQQCLRKIKELEDRLLETRDKLHLPLSDKEIAVINTNIYMKNQVENVSQKKKRLAEVKEELEQQYQEEKNVLEEIERAENLASSKVLSKQSRALLEERVNKGDDKKRLEWDLKAVQDKIEIYQQTLAREKTMDGLMERQKRLQFYFFELIFLVLFVYGVVTKQWILLSMAALGCVLIASLLFKKTKSASGKGTNSILHDLKDKEAMLQQRLQSTDMLEISRLEEQLAADDLRLEELQLLQGKCKQQQTQFERVITKFEKWEAESAQTSKELAVIARELKIPAQIAADFLAEAFELLTQYKSIWREKNQLYARVEQINEQLSKMEGNIRFFEAQFLQEVGQDLHQIAYLLRNKLKVEQEKQIKLQEKKGKLADLVADLQQKSQEIQLLQVELEKLFQAAKVNGEQEFYEMGAKAEKREQLLEQLKNLQNQLQYSILSEQEREALLGISNSEEQIRAFNQEGEELQQTVKTLQEEEAAINYEIQMLEEGGLYADILHQYKQKKSEVEEAAKQWSVYALAQKILLQTIDKYKDIHLPRMLSKAEEYLAILTNGSYHRIFLQHSGTGFLVERQDRTVFQANELSQATMEQLYISIRLALATTLYEKYRFPIIIDDSFVNFDAKRTQTVIELLKGLQGYQILFFTCHQHLLSYFQPDQILQLEKGAVQIS